MKGPHKNNVSIIDRIGISLSGLCAIHCALAAFGTLILPLSFGHASHHSAQHHEGLHLVLFALVLPTAFISFGKTWWKTKNMRPLVLGTLGIIFLVPSTFSGLEFSAEFAITSSIVGSLLLIWAHWKNHFQVCRHH